jgi:hypothetical protein
MAYVTLVKLMIKIEIKIKKQKTKNKTNTNKNLIFVAYTLLAMTVPGECYSINALCAQNVTVYIV